jgi:hypothetical protein
MKSALFEAQHGQTLIKTSVVDPDPVLFYPLDPG